ncbi:transporter family-2 protein [Kushneria sinocarnis]|uniref:Transporter family-2 protein n=1 Tax=Kushneria sinocarnis TaxID=595502 RepID=A0A420WXU3_9GAMM|nr:DMT family transporter [Kushneria sinocarnis]RKR04548.1 transporter family-2 protein [Kushneria sinocarnis]
MLLLWLGLAIVAGMLMPVQAGVNAALARVADSAIWAAMISFAVGTLTLLVAFTVTRPPWPSLETLGRAPWWSWGGGMLGAFFVASSVMLAPRLGAATLMATLLIGQMVASVMLDQIGWSTFPQHSLSFGRLAGIALLLAGLYLIQRY